MTPRLAVRAASVARRDAAVRVVHRPLVAAGLFRAGPDSTGWLDLLPGRAAGQTASQATQDDAELVRWRQVVRLYRLVLQTTPDRPGLRHHAALLASGSTLEDLAASLLSVSGSIDPNCRVAALELWSRAGGAVPAFESAWRQAEGLASLVAGLARRPCSGDAMPLRVMFPAGIDSRQDDVGPAWGYRLWAAEIDNRLRAVAGRARPLLRLFGSTILLTLPVGPATTAGALDATLTGLSRQIYGRWRLLLVGAPPPGWVAPRDQRIIACARPGAVEARMPAMRGVLHGVLEAGDVPAAACLALFALAALRRPAVSRWSCDEDSIDDHGCRSRPRLDRGRGLVLRRDGAGQSGRHLPAVLLHRDARRPAGDRCAGSIPQPRHRAAAVSLVIATRDRPLLLDRCMRGIRATTAALRPQVVIVDNGTTDPEALAILSACAAEGCVVLRRPGPFNWSALCNEGVRASGGATLVLMNNDVECLRPGWLEMLLAACSDPVVGVAGARLLHADGRTQHAGVLVGPGTVAAHRLADMEQDGCADRTVTAVTGACMAFRRTVFDQLGGLEEALPVTWNDLDFCLRARASGYVVRLVSRCLLRHDELGTRTADDAPENRAQMAKTLAFVARRHRRALRRDRFLHPLLLFAGGGRLLDPDAPSRIARLLLGGGID